MNCQEFENIIIDLARSQMMDAVLREHGLAHTEACPHCALRLADERALTAGLRALAASAEHEVAPPRIEAALRTAFRVPPEQVAPVAVDDRAVATAAVAFIQPPTPAWHWRRWAVAAAAVILAALALVAQSWWYATPPELVREVPVPAPTPLVPPPAPHKPTPAPVVPESKPQLVQRGTRPHGLENANYIPRADGRRGTRPVETQEVEIVTEFFPLTYNLNSDDLESAHIVRVRMPRTALLSFGLPINVERDSESVKADVVMGPDGLARAIRFVQ